MNSNHKPPMLYVLTVLLLLQGITGTGGGLMLMLRPDGAAMQMPISYLEGTPFENYFIPGLILFVFVGLYPLLVIFGLHVRRQVFLFESLNVYRNEMHWGWTHSVYSAIVLILWINFETLLVGYNWLQISYSLLGVAILVVTLLPSVKRYYRKATFYPARIA